MRIKFGPNSPMGTELSQDITTLLQKTGGETQWMSAYEVEHAARAIGIDVNRSLIRRSLSKQKKHVEYRTGADGVRRFHLRRQMLGDTSSQGARFVRPGTAWTSQRELREFLGNLEGQSLLLIDPYIGPETLDILADVWMPVQILTSHCGTPGKEAEFHRAFALFSSEKGRDVTVRILSASELHGRYIITPNSGWIIDHSLKDLGKKPAVIIPLFFDHLHSEITQYFDEQFNRGVEYSYPR